MQHFLEYQYKINNVPLHDPMKIIINFDKKWNSTYKKRYNNRLCRVTIRSVTLKSTRIAKTKDVIYNRKQAMDETDKKASALSAKISQESAVLHYMNLGNKYVT